MRITSSMLHNLNSARMNSIRSSWSSNSSPQTNGLSQNALRKKALSKGAETAAYESTKKAAADTREQAEKLMETGENSIWDKAEESGKNSDVLKTINQFIESYNDMMDGMKETGGSVNNIYRKQLSDAAMNNQELLSKVGVTVKKDGTLSVDESKLKEASLNDLKQAFGDSNSFVKKASVKSIYVEANAVSGISQLSNASFFGYNNYGGFNNYNSNGASLGNYFNTQY